MTIKIVDTTLRDGEQTPGVLFSVSEKVTIATLLDRAGVPCIEAGIPASGRIEQTAIKEILTAGLNAEIITWNRALKSDIDCSLSLNARFIHISLPVSNIMIESKLSSSKSRLLKQLVIAADYLKQEGVRFSVGAEDATRADDQFLKDYAVVAEESGAGRLRLCDTIGIADPFQIVNLVKRVKRATSLELEIHAHNDLGMATANALAAAKAGVSALDTTVIGLGERAGNTPLEEIVLALHLNMKSPTGIRMDQMKQLANTVAEAAMRPISRGKCVVGDEIFSHESGIHVDAIRKNPQTYEPYQPQIVGATRKLVIGKHSGPRAVGHKLNELGCWSTKDALEIAIRRIRELASTQKGGVSDQQILAIARKSLSRISSQSSVF